jgi:hypothetical protein
MCEARIDAASVIRKIKSISAVFIVQIGASASEICMCMWIKVKRITWCDNCINTVESWKVEVGEVGSVDGGRMNREPDSFKTGQNCSSRKTLCHVNGSPN